MTLIDTYFKDYSKSPEAVGDTSRIIWIHILQAMAKGYFDQQSELKEYREKYGILKNEK